MITVILDQLQQVKLLSTAKQQHITTSRYKSLQANREKKVQLCFESTSLTSKGQSREVLKEKLSASHSPLVLCKLAALWNSSLSWNTTREKQSTCMLEMRNELSQLQQENAKTSMQHAVASSTSPHNVKERMQSRFLHPVRFPTSQCKVKVCIERVCVSVRVCLTVYLRYRFTVFTFTKLCGVSIVPEKCNSTESRVMIIPQTRIIKKTSCVNLYTPYTYSINIHLRWYNQNCIQMSYMSVIYELYVYQFSDSIT